MGQIAPIIQQQIQDDPNADYRVLISLADGGKLPESLSGKGRFVVKDKVYAATVKGKDLSDLSNDHAIEAIEPDAEMGIL
jgi:hypothetical protein